MHASAASIDSTALAREAAFVQRDVQDIMSVLVAREIRDTFHEERALGGVATNRHE
jgi:hypothetical protein